MPRTPQTKYLPAFICALSLCALVSGCNTVPSQVNSAIAVRLPTMLGPADSYNVSSDGDILELLRGKLRHVHIHGDNVQLSPLVRVDAFDADAYDIHANTRTDAIASIGQVTFQVRINQFDLDYYMGLAQPQNVARGARLLLDGTAITYSDSVGVWGLRTPFSITGVLVPHPGVPSQLDFQATSASLAHLNIPRPIVRYLVARENPVVDLSQMKYPVAIRSAAVQSSVMTVSGSVNLSSLLGTTPGGSN